MYTIEVDDKILYHPLYDDPGYALINPVLTKERGRAGSLEFIMPKSNNQYNQIQKITSLISVYENSKEIFRGRCMASERRFSEQKKIKCEGSLSFLNDTLLRPFKHENTTLHAEFRTFVQIHNTKMPLEKQFRVGNITVPNETIEIISTDDYMSTMKVMQEKLCEAYGGYLSVRYSGANMYLDYTIEAIETCDQTIEFGCNMLDLTEYISAEDVYTRIIPLGDKMEDESGRVSKRLTIRSVNNDIDYLESKNGIEMFGLIEKEIIFEGIKDPQELLARGSVEIRKAIEQSISIDLKAIDLHTLHTEVERIDEEKNVQVISRPHGIDQIFPCTKVVRYLAEPNKDNFTFGNLRKRLSEKMSKRM